jgi:hypothetical protein
MPSDSNGGPALLTMEETRLRAAGGDTAVQLAPDSSTQVI